MKRLSGVPAISGAVLFACISLPCISVGAPGRPPASGGGTLLASGFLVSSDGHVLTCAHLVDTDAVRAKLRASGAVGVQLVVRMGPRTYNAEVMTVDKATDVAILRIKGRGLPTLALGSSSTVKTGQVVHGFGYTASKPKSAFGTVTGVSGGAIKTKVGTAGMLPGGPMVDSAARAIGVLAFKDQTGAASPIDAAKALLEATGVKFVEGKGAEALPAEKVKRYVSGALCRIEAIRVAAKPASPAGGAAKGPARGSRGTRRSQGFSAEAVDLSIQKGVAYLFSQQLADGSWPPHGDPARHFYPVGPTALAAYALLEAGVSPQDENMAKALEWLETHKSTKTYSIGIRANVWLAAERKIPKKYFNLLKRDALYLVDSCTGDGGYNYPATGKHPARGARFDNSNSQYGLLGVWAGAQGLVEIPRGYWDLTLKHWQRVQNRQGAWGYLAADESDCRATMTAGGIASLFVCFDNLYADKFVTCRGGTTLPAIDKGLAWLDKNFDSTIGGTNHYYYYLYGVERVGLATGYKYFGTHDWYKAGATQLLKKQGAAGNWGSVVNTCFALLFMVRGRNAIIFNKLQFNGDWNNRPRDLAGLTRWLSRTFETTVNWQIINLKVPVSEWHDAPILYISGAKAPEFTKEEKDKLRTFLHQGGTIFSATECGGAAFRTKIREVYAELLPRYKLQAVQRSHPIYSKKVHYNLPGMPKFHIASNGVRPLIIHTDMDIPLSWQLRKTATRKEAFHAAANVAKYVTGTITLLRPRGTTHWPGKIEPAPRRTVMLVRLKHAGNFDPEPLAHERFARLMAEETRTKVDILGPLDIRDLPATGANVATLTGTDKLTLTAEEQDSLKAFVTGGGTLVVDAAGGDRAFATSAEALLKKIFGSYALRRLAGTAPLYRLEGYEIPRVRYRKQTRKRLGGTKQGMVKAVLIDRKRPGVFFSPEDLTGGLVGYPSFTVDGYHPDSAFELVRNMVLLAAGADGPAPTGPTRKKTAPRSPRPRAR